MKATVVPAGLRGYEYVRAVGGSTRNELTALVLERFTGCLLIVELPLRKTRRISWGE